MHLLANRVVLEDLTAAGILTGKVHLWAMDILVSSQVLNFLAFSAWSHIQQIGYTIFQTTCHVLYVQEVVTHFIS